MPHLTTAAAGVGAARGLSDESLDDVRSSRRERRRPAPGGVQSRAQARKGANVDGHRTSRQAIDRRRGPSRRSRPAPPASPRAGGCCSCTRRGTARRARSPTPWPRSCGRRSPRSTPTRRRSAPSPAGYDAVVVGGPMIMGWHKDARRYLKRHKGQLSDVPFALFVTAASLTEDGVDAVQGMPDRQGPLAGEEAAQRGEAEPQGALRAAAALRGRHPQGLRAGAAAQRGRCSPARST